MYLFLPLLMRWLHIASVVVLIGGSFMRAWWRGEMVAAFKPVA